MTKWVVCVDRFRDEKTGYLILLSTANMPTAILEGISNTNPFKQRIGTVKYFCCARCGSK